jgi:cell division protein FtsW
MPQILEPTESVQANIRARIVHETRVTRPDGVLMTVTLVLVAFGLVFVYSASAHQALHESGNSAAILIKQVLAAIIGLVVMQTISRTNYQFWRKSAVGMAFIAIGLLGLTMVVGTTANGSERWLPLPFGFQFQPSDFAKLAAICLIAQATSQPTFLTPVLARNIVLVGFMILLIYQQPNLSVSMILASLSVMMLFVAGVPWWLFAMGAPPVLYFLYNKIRTTEYQWRRIQGWLDPWKDPQDTGYNLIQSWYAIGSGGVLGVGLGHSVQKLYYLPFQHTDFIFSVVCEELGLMGALLVIGMFGVLAWRGFAISFNCPSRFGQMLAFGITSAIVLQALINISVTVGLMPVTGVTLPLISYGGTSMIITLLMIGILLNISRYKLNARVLESD